jgi:hypothetical protein
MPIRAEAWVEHPTSDVAVAEVALRDDVHEVALVPLDLLADGGLVAEYDIGEGDEVFMPGLFTRVPGETRDQPIIRFGHIALGLQDSLVVEMPSGNARMSAYLIEARSWGGHSGSPVFVSTLGSEPFGAKREGIARLLGLIHGHYEIETKIKFKVYEDDAAARSTPGSGSSYPHKTLSTCSWKRNLCRGVTLIARSSNTHAQPQHPIWPQRLRAASLSAY